MKILLYLATFFLLFLTTACETPAVKSKVENQPLLSVDTLIFRQMIDSMYKNVPHTKGIIMHVEAPEYHLSWSGAIGWADSSTGRRLKPTDPALIASNTKTYVSAAILRLVEQGKLDLFQPIGTLLPPKTDSLLQSDGYDTKAIHIAHLLSHTGGIEDYTNSQIFLDKTQSNPGYQWTRWEQMALTISDLDPIGPPGKTFSYSDLNSLLLGEIIEVQTGQPFYTALRQLLQYDQLGLQNTWFNLLEEAPKDLSPLVHQFATQLNVDSYTLHGSFDLYGGGGIAATASDLALFSQNLFEGKFFENPGTIDLIHTEITTEDSIPANYYMSIAKSQYGPFVGYGHGGFWGTTVQYFPELNASVAIFLMERDEWQRYKALLQGVATILHNAKTKQQQPVKSNAKKTD